MQEILARVMSGIHHAYPTPSWPGPKILARLARSADQQQNLDTYWTCLRSWECPRDEDTLQQGKSMFAREHELVAHLASQHRRLWPSGTAHRSVKAERGYGSGVADLVLLDFDSVAQSRRQTGGLPPLPSACHAYVVGALRSLGSTPFSACGRLDPNVNERENLRILRHLVETGYVLRLGSTVVLPPEMASPIRRIIAIEAKLTDWRGGLLQAHRYRAYADLTYLAMPMVEAQRAVARHADVALALGIGIIGVDESARILLRAGRGRPKDSGVRAWAEESEFADALGCPRRLASPFPARFSVPSPDQLVAGAV